MKKIVIDMDDVICTQGFLGLVNAFLGKNYTEEDIKGYYIQDLVPDDKKEEWNKFFLSHNMYNYVNKIDNASDVIAKLNEVYDVYILSAYILRETPRASGEFLKNKFNWLCEHLPFFDPNKFIFTTNKDNIKCDIRIDDKLSNLSGEAETKLLFSSYHNKKYTAEELEKLGVRRVESWLEIKRLLLQ